VLALGTEPGRGQRGRAGQRAQRDQPGAGPVGGPGGHRRGQCEGDGQGEADRVDRPEAGDPQSDRGDGYRGRRREPPGHELARPALRPALCLGRDGGVHG